MGKARVFVSSERPICVLSHGEINLSSVIGADISWKDLGDRIWNSGGHDQYRGQ